MTKLVRTPILVANWKMYKTVEEARAYGRNFVRLLEEKAGWDPSNREVVICPPAINIWPLSQIFSSTSIQVGAQNLDLGQEGALTGALSGYLLKEAGARYVIVGHSERRRDFGETDSVVVKKTQAALDAGLRPIICVGENESEYDSGSTEEILLRQLSPLFESLTVEQIPSVVVAYEPIWAIGTGRVPDPTDTDRIAGRIRQWATERVGPEARALRILYGGSVSPKNIQEFWSKPQIDGGLVGGASLSANDFAEMVTTPLS